MKKLIFLFLFLICLGAKAQDSCYIYKNLTVTPVSKSCLPFKKKIGDSTFEFGDSCLSVKISFSERNISLVSIFNKSETPMVILWNNAYAANDYGFHAEANCYTNSNIYERTMLYGHNGSAATLDQLSFSKGDTFPKKVKVSECDLCLPLVKNGATQYLNFYFIGKNQSK